MKKRLLSLLLALCLLFGAASPAAAVTLQSGSGTGNSGSSQTGSAITSSPNFWKDLVVSPEDAQGIPTLRNELDADKFAGISNPFGGSWSATLSDITASLMGAQLPQSVQDLRAAASSYSSEDVVSAFVVLEADPMVDDYSSINDVPAAKLEQAANLQKAIINRIESDVLAGEKLTVVTQFSYLTNAIVIETEFGNLEKIAYLQGVETVFLTPVFYPCVTDTTIDPLTVSSGQMTGVDSVWYNQTLGYTGEGMTIAVLDTGLDLDHPSFAAAPEGAAWDVEFLESVVGQLNAAVLYNMETGKELSASDLYYSAKVPFRFNYSMGSTNVGHNDGIGDHGTHVAGIAGANQVEGTGVVGMAPDAQIVVMKVFNSETGGANMYDILNALEDAMRLGCDVANLSLGSAAGFSQSGVAVIDEIYASISKTDLIVDVAAGNEGTSAYGSLWGNYMNTTDNVDTSTISSPSTYVNALSIASVDNVYVMSDYFALADGTKVFYQPSVEYLYGYTTIGLVETLADQKLEYVMVPGLGEVADFYDEDGNSIVEGKIAVVSRGDLSFSEKAANAEAAGAVAVLIWNNVSENIFAFGMTTEAEDGSYPGIPVALISLEDGQKMAEAEAKDMTVASQQALRMDSAGGQMSSFSCWGVSPDLRLLPDITGVGGNVYSCYDGGEYGLMSGTSMATPQVAGVTALVLQYLQENYDLSTEELRTIVDALMMSTAEVVIDQDTGLEASPRQQGAGLVNALYAVTAESYLTVGGGRPKGELGDSESGTYSFTFTVHNFGSESKTYTLTSSLLCEDYATDENYPGVYFMAEQEHQLDNSAVSFSADSVTVPAGGTADVTVTIDLTSADKEWIDTYFANGNYVEGFVYLSNEDESGVDLSLPFMGFYGDWTDAPIFDTGFWYDNGFWTESGEIEANMYYSVLWTSLGTTEIDWVLGFSPYTGAIYDEDGNLVYSPETNVLSPNGDGVLDNISEYYLSLMRNAQWVYLTYTDENGNVLDVDALDYISKTMFNSNYGATVPFVYTWYYDNLYDFTDAEGNYLPNGTKLTLTISGVLDYEGAEEQIMVQVPITIDTAAPELLDVKESTEEDGNYLILTVMDENLNYVALMNKTGTQIYSDYSNADFTDNGDGTYTVKVDVTGLGDKITVALCDYGCNEQYYDLTYTLTDNTPVMDTTALYAYQVYNEYIFNYYGWDYMFGWSTIDKENAGVTMISSDAYEYYALTAAEYAGGYIFAVDAGYNFLYMTPGLWNRNMICNLGVNVIDMAFDETTGTMYLTTKTETDNGPVCCLYTVDLLTGDLKQLKQYSSEYAMPWTMTFVDGELYCCKYYYSGFYQVDIEGGTYDLIAVTDAEGNEFKPVNSTGANVSPYYSQSMTYSEADGVIYWAYYSSKETCELITIDPATWTNTAVMMDWDQEYVGLLTLEDDGYTLPESTEVTKLLLSQSRLVLSEGETGSLSVSALPWNAPAGQVTWTSSDERIATVDEDGIVTARTEGSAVITATMGDLSVSCPVTVVNISGGMYAYDYFSGDGSWGDWMYIDLKSMTSESVVTSPIDFIAADYNGHDGKIYGYSESKNFYSFDPVTGECVDLGVASALPFDMVYDYSSGLMYAMVPDYNSWTTTIYYVNLLNGALIRAGTIQDIYSALACDLGGRMYGVNFYGQLHMLTFKAGSTVINVTNLMQLPASELQLVQSMCYDYQNDVLLWACPEAGSIYWVDVHAEDPFAIDLGEPTGSGTIEFTGLFTIPEQIPELDYIPVERIEGADMMLLTDSTKLPSITIYPLNASNQEVTYVSSDESIVKVENGALVGVSAGTAIITATLVDEGETYECTFNVSVKNNTDNIYAYLAQDIVSGNGYAWVELPDEDPNNYANMDYVYYNDVYLTLYAAEYLDGRIYAYGFDDTDWEANFQFLTIDAATWSVVSSVDMGNEFPFVYDMAFDYTTGTMYAVAGTQYATDLYMVNLANGELIESVLTDPMFMSLAIDGNGTIYAMAASEDISEIDSWVSTYTNAKLYTIDVKNDTYKMVMDTGVVSNMLASMAYDHDTGYLYWTGFGSVNGSYISGLYLIDPADMSCHNLGTIGAGGSQVTGLMIMADEHPEIPDTLQNLSVTSKIAEVAVGSTVAIETFLQPANLDVDMVWSSDDESIATVDENGVVTGVSAGTTTVTVTVKDDGKIFTGRCKIIVYGVEDYFLTYNLTDGGFAAINRPDSTLVTNLTEGEAEADVRSMAVVDGVIYAYDEEGNFFVTSEDDGYVRSYIGGHGIEVDEPYSEETVSGPYTYHYDYVFGFAVRDMAWDAANNRLLAVGCHYVHQTTKITSTSMNYEYEDLMELYGGCKLYEVDLTTGTLTELVMIGNVDGPVAGVQAITITDSGDAYIYSTYMDFVCKLDTETGSVTQLTTLQNIGASGSADGEPMAMAYDAFTNSIYLLITQNGTTYQMYKFNVATTAVSAVGEVDLEGNSFAGLIVHTHTHTYEYTNTVAPTCDEDGYDLYTCVDCGETMTVVDEGTALGHDFVDGVCTVCGENELAVGDINDDGEADVMDANLAIAYYYGNVELTDIQMLAADVNGDGEVDVMDANLIIAYYYGNIDSFPVEN